MRWAVENPALAQLLYWRPVPGFAPAAAAFAPSVALMDQLRAAFAAAVQAGELHPNAASAEAPRLWTIVLSGLISQQMANEPSRGLRHRDIHQPHRCRARHVLRPVRAAGPNRCSPPGMTS